MISMSGANGAGLVLLTTEEVFPLGPVADVSVRHSASPERRKLSETKEFARFPAEPRCRFWARYEACNGRPGCEAATFAQTKTPGRWNVLSRARIGGGVVPPPTQAQSRGPPVLSTVAAVDVQDSSLDSNVGRW